MDSVIDWLNDNSGAVQAIATATLVVVTAVYAWSTHRMAREMAETRRGSLRPIIGINPSKRDHSVISTRIENYGAGPALDVWFLCFDGRAVKENRIDVLAVDAEERELRHGGWIQGQWPLLVDPVSGEARVHYRDVFGDEWTTALKLKGFQNRTRDEHQTTKGWATKTKGDTQA